MKQKLITAAVAGAFALPGVALAQVSITGSMEVGFDNQKVGNAAAARATLHKKQTALISGAEIRFNVAENLGGGLEFYGYYEFRPQLDGANDGGDSMPVGSTTAPAFIGLRNPKSWGSVRFGNLPTISSKAGGKLPTAFRLSSQRLIDFTTVGTAPLSFGSGRVANVIIYTMPAMGGLTLDVAYSTNAKSNDSDMLNASTVRKGQAYEIMPSYDAGSFKFGGAHSNIKYDVASGGIFPDVKSNKLFFETELAGIVVGLNWRSTKVRNPVTGVDASKTKAWSLPISYQTGPHHFGMYYAKAGDDTVTAGDNRAKMVGIGYNYAMSKRTSLSVAYNKMDNASPDAAGVGGSSYEMGGNGGFADGAAGFSALVGEDVSAITVGLHHKF